MTLKLFYTHDNGGRPFRIQFDDNSREVEVFREDDNHLIEVYTPERLFIGKSPRNRMTLYSGGYGREFDGNSILLHLRDDRYVYIGEKIFSFKSLAKIIEYVSPVGNNDVPYPYARDEDGNYYLMIEDVILMYRDDLEEKIREFDDPYSYYYAASLITPDRGYIPPQNPIYNFEGIVKYMIGEETYTFRYHPDAARDFDRLVKNDNDKMWIVDKDMNKFELNKEGYIALMNRFGEMAGFTPLIIDEMIEDRG